MTSMKQPYQHANIKPARLYEMAMRNEMTDGGFDNPRPFLYEMNLGNIIS